MNYILAMILALVTISCGAADVEVNETETSVLLESRTEMTEMPEESEATDVTPDDSNAEVSEAVE